MTCHYCGETDHVEERHEVITYLQPSLHTIEEFDELRAFEVKSLGGRIETVLDSAPNAYLPPGYLEVWGDDSWSIVKEVTH